jgi:uncharacterized protein YciI
MLFALIGFLKPGAEIPQEVNQQTSEFVQQPYIEIHSWGPLCDDHGRRAGMMMVFEHEDRAKAETFVANSPYVQAGLYERHHLYEYRNEGG